MSVPFDSQEPTLDTTSADGALPRSAQLPGSSSDSAAAGLARVVDLVERRFADPLSMRDLTAAAGMPANSLTRAFNRIYGMSPKRWVWYFRTILAAELIAREPEMPLSQAWSRCGFVSAAHFSRRFREVYREAPTTWRQRLCAGGARVRPGLADKPQFRRLTREAGEAAARALARLGRS